MGDPNLLPTERDLEQHFRDLYGDVRKHGWRVRMMHRFGHSTAEAWYEATVERLVTPGCVWLDVGGGKSIFPHNPELSAKLAQRCAVLVGVDPSDNIATNPFVHERAQCLIEDYHSERQFDLATLRMVAEHIQETESAVRSLARLVKPGGRVLVYTPNRWSPVSLAAAAIPFRLHQPITHFLWGTKEEDVFPTVYRMNTRRALRALFEQGGFTEVAFAHLDNCNTLQRFRATCFAELSVWWVLHKLGLHYPENNLLGIYQRRADA